MFCFVVAAAVAAVILVMAVVSQVVGCQIRQQFVNVCVCRGRWPNRNCPHQVLTHMHLASDPSLLNSFIAKYEKGAPKKRAILV